MRPGCTGFWQISDACTGLIADAPEYDRYYVAHRGVRFDLWVLGHTAAKMLGRPRFPKIEDVPAWVVEPVGAEVVELRPEAEPVPITVAAGGR